MNLVYILEKNLRIERDGKDLYLICPKGFKGEKYSSNQLLVSFMKTIKLPVKGMEETEIEGDLIKISLRTGKYKDYDKYIYVASEKRTPNISEEPHGILMDDTYIEEDLNGGITVNEIKNKRKFASGNIDENIRNFFIKTENGYDCKVYQLPKNIKKLDRVIFNSNILFANISELVKKQYHIVIINEQLTGGVVFLHNKNARPGDKFYHLDFVFKAIEELLASELSGKWHVVNSIIPTYNEKGGLTKVPLKIEKKETKKLLEE